MRNVTKLTYLQNFFISRLIRFSEICKSGYTGNFTNLKIVQILNSKLYFFSRLKCLTCMYLCIFVGRYECLFICLYYACISLPCMYVYMHACVSAWTHISESICIYVSIAYIYGWMQTCMNVHIYVCVYVDMYEYPYIGMYVCMHACL